MLQGRRQWKGKGPSLIARTKPAITGQTQPQGRILINLHPNMCISKQTPPANEARRSESQNHQKPNLNLLLRPSKMQPFDEWSPPPCHYHPFFFISSISLSLEK